MTQVGFYQTRKRGLFNLIIFYFLADPALPPPPMNVPALHPLLVHHADNQLSSGAFSRFRQLCTTTTGTTTAPNQTNINVLSTQANPMTNLTFGQQNRPATTILTGQSTFAAQQQINQQPQRSRIC